MSVTFDSDLSKTNFKWTILMNVGWIEWLGWHTEGMLLTLMDNHNNRW